MALSRDDVDAHVKQILAEHIGVDPAKVTDDADIAIDLGADSLDLMELIMTMEEDFDIEISDEQVETTFEDGKYPVSRIIDEVMKLV